MKAQFILAICFAAFGTISLHAQNETSLDGQTYKIDTWDETKSNLKTPETLVFKDGMVDAPICHEYGFFASPYNASQEGSAYVFSFTNESEYEGTLYFTGTIRGKKIEGSYIWKKEGREDLEYRFEGKLN